VHEAHLALSGTIAVELSPATLFKTLVFKATNPTTLPEDIPVMIDAMPTDMSMTMVSCR